MAYRRGQPSTSRRSALAHGLAAASAALLLAFGGHLVHSLTFSFRSAVVSAPLAGSVSQAITPSLDEKRIFVTGRLPPPGSERGAIHPPRAEGASGRFVPRVPQPAPQQLSSVFQSTVNIMKNIVGAGMLSLPKGVAAFGGSPQALIPALAVALVLSMVSAYTFIVIGDLCRKTGTSSFSDAWAATVGPNSKALPTAACLGKAGIGTISFMMIIGDCLSVLLSPLGLPPFLASRSAAIVWTSLLVLLPLCCMKSLAPLAKFSFAGVLSNVYISCFILLRCFDGSYRPGGAFFKSAPVAPAFVRAQGGPWSALTHPGFTVLISILGTAYLAHYNAPLYYEQLAPDRAGQRGARFRTASTMGFAGSALIFCAVMSGGFLTFGKSSMGLILNNYASGDVLAMFARAAILVSLITAFPLVFFSLRKQVIGLFGSGAERFNAERPTTMTVMLLAAVMAIALNLRDLGKLASFAGACFGSLLIYIGPSVMALSSGKHGRSSTLNRAIQVALIPLGVAMGVLGVMQTFK